MGFKACWYINVTVSLNFDIYGDHVTVAEPSSAGRMPMSEYMSLMGCYLRRAMV
jgi:hypothetical protein